MTMIPILFPIMAVAAAAVAYLAPQIFAPYGFTIVPLLAVIMFGMGLTLTIDDFKRVAQQPFAIGLGIVLQFTWMPLAAFAIGHMLSLTPELLAGMVLLGSSPGGTASNVMAYLARANVALSVTMTMASTLLAVVATPVLTWLLVGRTVPVDVGAMLLNMLQIVLAPVLIGVLLNTFFPHRLARLRPLLPVIAMTAILVIIAVIVAASQQQLAAAALIVVVAVMLHNLTGFAAGYGIARWLGFDEPTCRTLCIEVGMQNSGLSVALAMRFFSPMAALPGAIFSIWHTIAGALLAGYWSSRPSDPVPTGAAE